MLEGSNFKFKDVHNVKVFLTRTQVLTFPIYYLTGLCII